MTSPAARRRRALLPAAMAAFAVLAAGEPPAMSAQTGSASGHYHRGERLYEEGDLAGALRAFQQAYAIDPKARRGERIGMHFEDYDPAFQLGRLHARLGNFEQARGFFALAAAGGYTERSRNAEEYRRWRTIVERTLAAAARPPHPPEKIAEPAPTRPPLVVTAPPDDTPAPPATATALVIAAGAIRTPTPRATRTAAVFASPTVALAAAAVTAPLPAAALSTPPPFSTRISERSPADTRAAARDSPGLPEMLLFAAAVTLTVLVLVLRRGRRARPVGEGVVPFGRYAITGLLGAGRNSFVYEARDGRKSPVALRVRRADLPHAETERFSREATALERTRRLGEDVPAARLLGRGLQKTANGALEFLALEKLYGMSLLELSRSARRRIDPTLSVEILQEVASALRRLRGLGLTNDEVAAEDVFVLDPLPANAGNAIRLKILGLCVGPADSRRDAAALAAIAAELFRARAPTSEQDEWLADHVPTALRQVLGKARESAGPEGASFEDVEKALRETTGSHPEPS